MKKLALAINNFRKIDQVSPVWFTFGTFNMTLMVCNLSIGRVIFSGAIVVVTLISPAKFNYIYNSNVYNAPQQEHANALPTGLYVIT